jgi:hypothetical protein
MWFGRVRLTNSLMGALSAFKPNPNTLEAPMKAFQSSLTPAADVAYGTLVQTLMDENRDLKAALAEFRAAHFAWLEVKGEPDDSEAFDAACHRMVEANKRAEKFLVPTKS